MNDEWARFFAEQHFLIGLSIDGPASLHNHYRFNRAGKGTHEQVVAAMARLKAHHVDFNTLTVVGKHNVGHAADVYEFLLAAGSRFIQFIPLVERMSTDNSSVLNLVMPGESAATLAPWTVPSWQYGEFLNQIFDIWVRRDVDRVYVQMFDVALAARRRSSRYCVYIPRLVDMPSRWSRTAISTTATTLSTRSICWEISTSTASKP